jgi:zinc transport system substrate-binding protein
MPDVIPKNCQFSTSLDHVWPPKRRIVGIAAYFLAQALLFFSTPATADEQPRVAATIAPVHSLTASVMDGVAAPILLTPPGTSPHFGALRPSQVSNAHEAHIVFWIGPDLETMFAGVLAAAPQKTTIVELSAMENLTLHPTRTAGVWTLREGNTGSSSDQGVDPHIWLDPQNSRLIAQKIADVLSKRFPVYADQFQANAMALDVELLKLMNDLHSNLQPIAQRRFLVWHDAYQYFEQRYELSPLGAVTETPDRPPGARRLSAMRVAIGNQPLCLFVEPQVKPRAISVLSQDGNLKTRVLDPIGLDIPPGPHAYDILMRQLGQTIAACLGDD